MTDITKQLAEALRHIENAATDLRVQRYEIRAAATEALAAHEAEQALPLKDRPDFIAGYDAGLKDGRACERRDAAEQAAQAVPAGFKWVPVEPTEDMLFAAELSKPRGYRDLWAAMLAAAPAAPEAPTMRIHPRLRAGIEDPWTVELAYQEGWGDRANFTDYDGAWEISVTRAKAMQGFMSVPGAFQPKLDAQIAYEMADAMLAERNKE